MASSLQRVASIAQDFNTHGKIQIRLGRHDQALCLDGLQRLFVVSSVSDQRDVAGLPCVQERKHVVRVPVVDESAFPIFAQPRSHVRIASVQVSFFRE